MARSLHGFILMKDGKPGNLSSMVIFNPQLKNDWMIKFDVYVFARNSRTDELILILFPFYYETNVCLIHDSYWKTIDFLQTTEQKCFCLFYVYYVPKWAITYAEIVGQAEVQNTLKGNL